MQEPIENRIEKINRRLQSLDPNSVEAITLASQRDGLYMQIEELESIGYFNGPTGHGDICYSDADPGL